MEKDVVSKIKELQPDALDDYAKEYEENACTGQYHLGNDFFPYHLSDAIFLHDNAYHYLCNTEGKKIKTKISTMLSTMIM